MKHTLTLSILCVCLSACSPVDSTKVFDQQQTANLLHQNRTIHPTKQMIKLSLPKQYHWKRIDMSLNTVGTPIMLIPNDDTIDHWHQSIRTNLLAFMNDHDATVASFINDEITTIKHHCQHATTDILSMTKTTAIYRFDLVDCGDEKNQRRIGKVFLGEDAIYSVYYTAETGQVPESQMNQLSQAVTSAQLVRTR